MEFLKVWGGGGGVVVKYVSGMLRVGLHAAMRLAFVLLILVMIFVVQFIFEAHPKGIRCLASMALACSRHQSVAGSPRAVWQLAYLLLREQPSMDPTTLNKRMKK